MSQENTTRRPLAIRQAAWARSMASWLTRRGAQPNHISILSLVFAALAGLFIILSTKVDMVPGIILLLLAGGCILMRGLCNMLDGMVGIEGGRQS